eukprot:COSAG02_NODE_2365_length_9052_cov_11.510779_1_plen_77_part_10
MYTKYGTIRIPLEVLLYTYIPVPGRVQLYAYENPASFLVDIVWRRIIEGDQGEAGGTAWLFQRRSRGKATRKSARRR